MSVNVTEVVVHVNCLQIFAHLHYLGILVSAVHISVTYVPANRKIRVIHKVNECVKVFCGNREEKAVAAMLFGRVFKKNIYSVLFHRGNKRSEKRLVCFKIRYSVIGVLIIAGKCRMDNHILYAEHSASLNRAYRRAKTGLAFGAYKLSCRGVRLNKAKSKLLCRTLCVKYYFLPPVLHKRITVFKHVIKAVIKVFKSRALVFADCVGRGLRVAVNFTYRSCDFHSNLLRVDN